MTSTARTAQNRRSFAPMKDITINSEERLPIEEALPMEEEEKTNTNQIEIFVYESDLRSLTSGFHHIFRPSIIYNPIRPCCCRGIVEVGDAVDVDIVMSLEHQTPIIVDPEM